MNGEENEVNEGKGGEGKRGFDREERNGQRNNLSRINKKFHPPT